MGRIGNSFEKLGLALVSRALLSKALIQLSADGWGCAPSLVIFWPKATQPSKGSMVRLVVASKKVYTRGDLPRQLLPVPCTSPHPCPSGEPLLIYTSTGDPPTQVVLVQFPVESLILSSESWCMQGFVFSLQDWSLWYPSPVEIL